MRWILFALVFFGCSDIDRGGRQEPDILTFDLVPLDGDNQGPDAPALFCPGGTGCPCITTSDCGSGNCQKGACAPTCDTPCPKGMICESTGGSDPIEFCVIPNPCKGMGDQTFCDDADPCTVGDKCLSEQCTSGTPLDCEDNNPCTVDACQAGTGCTHKPLDGLLCEDGDPCTVADVCASGACKPGASLQCPAGSACTVYACQDGACKPEAVEGPCTDGNPCTGKDACLAGICQGSPLSCDDGNPCTFDLCDATKGCVQVPQDADCTVAGAEGTCQGGACVAVEPDPTVTEPYCKVAFAVPAGYHAGKPVQSFWIDKYPAHWSEYMGCISEGSCDTPDTGSFGVDVLYTGVSYPFEDTAAYVTSAQAQQFCAWRGAKVATLAQIVSGSTTDQGLCYSGTAYWEPLLTEYGPPALWGLRGHLPVVETVPDTTMWTFASGGGAGTFTVGCPKGPGGVLAYEQISTMVDQTSDGFLYCVFDQKPVCNP